MPTNFGDFLSKIQLWFSLKMIKEEQKMSANKSKIIF